MRLYVIFLQKNISRGLDLSSESADMPCFRDWIYLLYGITDFRMRCPTSLTTRAKSSKHTRIIGQTFSGTRICRLCAKDSHRIHNSVPIRKAAPGFNVSAANLPQSCSVICALQTLQNRIMQAQRIVHEAANRPRVLLHPYPS